MKRIMTCLGLVAMAVFGEVSTPNLVKNAGFEDTGNHKPADWWDGKEAVYKVVDGGRNGGKCLAFENNEPKRYELCTQNVPCEPGAIYEFSCWVKTEDLKGDEAGATVCMEYSGGEDGKTYLGGVYPGGPKGSKDWTFVRGEAKIPQNATKISIVVYARQGMTGKAWFDDVTCKRYYPPMVRYLTDNLYRDVVASGLVEFHIGLNVKVLDLDVKAVRGAFTVFDESGRQVKEFAPAKITDTYAMGVLDSSELPNGKYRVKASFSLKNGTHHGESERWIEKVARLPERKNYIDEYGRLIVDGKPFFPLGMYWSGISQKDLELYAKTPFNTLMPYGAPTDVKVLDMIDKLGLKLIYSIKDIYVGTTWCPKGIQNAEDEEAFIRDRVTKFGSHPALLAWYINDELPQSMIKRLAERQKLMQQLDPDHPTWVVLYQFQEVRDYMDSFDVIGTDPYPIPGDCGKAALQARTVREQTYGTRAFWQVPQAFDWACYRKTEEERAKTAPPTEAEIRSMSWQSIANGANGLVYYSFFDLKSKVVKIPFEESFGRVCRVAAEVKSYVPVIMSIEKAPTATMTGGEGVDMRVWKYNGRIYVLAVNSTPNNVDAEIMLSEDFAECKNELGVGGVKKSASKKVSAQFTAYEPKMIVLQ